MYIDDFIWLPDILDKLAIKHQVRQDEVEEIFLIVRVTVLSNPATGKAKMFIPPADKLTRDDI